MRVGVLQTDIACVRMCACVRVCNFVTVTKNMSNSECISIVCTVYVEIQGGEEP